MPETGSDGITMPESSNLGGMIVAAIFIGIVAICWWISPPKHDIEHRDHDPK